MARFPFIGPTYSSASLSADCQDTVNLYPEVVESGQAINQVVLYGTPGLSAFATVGTGPIRALWSGENRMFCISGSHLWEVYADATSADRGSVGNDGKPAQILANGNQLLVVSAGEVWCDNGSGVVQVTFPTLSGYVNTIGFTAVIAQLSGVVNTDSTGVVTFVSGINFVAGAPMVGQTIVINFVSYTVAASPAPTTTVLSVVEPIVAMTGAPYDCTLGDLFDPVHCAGQVITINGVGYTVSATGSTALNIILTGGILSLSVVPWSCTPVVTAQSGTYLDGYFIVSEPNSPIFRISALLDGLTWDPLDYATKEAYPDNISAVMADHEYLWIFGDEAATEIWVDTGNANFPLQRSPGTLIHYGCYATDSPVQLDNGVAWVGGDQIRGGPIAWHAIGSQPMRVSNHAVENAWRAIGYVGDAWSYSYIENGHHFWVINFPTGNQTWVYDATTKMWHKRAYWKVTGGVGANVRQLQATHCYVGLAAYGISPFLPPAHYVGDYTTGAIYKQSLGTFTDAGTAIHRIRITPHTQKENQRWFCSKFELLADVTQGTITPTLDYSVDRGANFINPQQKTTANTLTDPDLVRLIWWRLGVSRDRIWRLTITDAVFIALIDAYYDGEEGTN